MVVDGFRSFHVLVLTLNSYSPWFSLLLLREYKIISMLSHFIS